MPKEATGITVKARLNLKIDSDLKKWATDYASKQDTTVTELIVGYFRYLRELEQREEDLVEQI